MARRKGALKSNDTDQGWRNQQNEAQIRKMLANDVNEESISVTLSSRGSHVTVNADSQKAIYKESSPPNLFNNSISLKYLHKKFKRIASAVTEDSYDKVKTDVNTNHETLETTMVTPTATKNTMMDMKASQFVLTAQNFMNGENSMAIDVQSHINKSEMNSQAVAAKCIQCRRLLDDQQSKACYGCNLELLNMSAKYDHDLLKNEYCKTNASSFDDFKVSGPNTSSCMSYDTDSTDDLNKSKIDRSSNIISKSLSEQNTSNEYELTATDLRIKSSTMEATTPLQHFKENFIHDANLDQSAKRVNTSTSSKNIGNNSANANLTNRSLLRKKNCERKTHFSKQRLSHSVKSGNYTRRIPSEDVDLDISQSTSSDLELSSCSTTTSSDIISRSTTPPEESLGASIVSQTPLNYCNASTGAHSIASLTAPDRPYKPKFHKAVFYQNNTNINNNTSSISKKDHSVPSIYIESKQDSVNNESSTVSHLPLSTQSVEYLSEHISKILSENDAILEGLRGPAFQRKLSKNFGITRNNSTNANTAIDLHVQPHTSISIPQSIKKTADEMLLKICDYPDAAPHESVKSSNRTFPTLQQQAQQALKKSYTTPAKSYTPLIPLNDSQPLNLTNASSEAYRKRSTAIDSVHGSGVIVPTSNISTESSAAAQNPIYENHHPQNPERSIIKSLLLNSRGLAVPTTGEGEDAIYTCPLCNTSCRSADNLQYHTKSYCQGTPQTTLPLPSQANSSPHSAPISPVGSPSNKYFRSNSFNLYRPDKYSPNTLAKLASSSLRHHRTPLSLAKLAAQQAAYLNKTPGCVTSLYSGAISGLASGRNVIDAGSLPSSSTIAGTSETQSVSSQCIQITKQLMDATLPSPGPLLGKTRLVDHYNITQPLPSIPPPPPPPPPPLQSHTVIKSKESINNFGKISEAIIPPAENASLSVDANKVSPSKETVNPSINDELILPRGQKLLQMCGGDVTIVEKTEEKVPRFGSSGGSIVSISSSPDLPSENSPLNIRSGLLSGGSIIEAIPPKNNASTPSVSSNSVQQILPNLSHFGGSSNLMSNYFQFPTPINSITAYNPLTLPPKQPEFHSNLTATIEATKIVHGGKIIPFVPGIPGPNSLSSNAQLSPIKSTLATEQCSDVVYNPNPSTSLYSNSMIFSSASYRSINLPIPSPAQGTVISTKSPGSPSKPTTIQKQQLALEYTDSSSNTNHSYKLCATPQQQLQQNVWPMKTTNRETSSQTITEKSFNFMRIADNLSPPKIRTENSNKTSHSNFEMPLNLDKMKQKSKSLIHVPEILPLHINVETNVSDSVSPNLCQPYDMTSEKIKMQPNVDSDRNNVVPSKSQAKFLRPCSLPLKPGTFTPKKHHGITPTANTLPLISPETPRPSKHCIQLYLNGHAYTYLGLKCSTKTFYCTVNRPQPVYAAFASRPELSMYSNWQTCAENNPHPLGFSPKDVMSMYDSRQRTHNNHQGSKFTVSNKLVLVCAPSDKTKNPVKVFDSTESNVGPSGQDGNVSILNKTFNKTKGAGEVATKLSNVEDLSTVPGGYKSNEDYTYVRGRGRGRYVCSECGMRCIKPCTLKKHIRTVHSDIRPYTCQHCMFSFKTKGNLTKHMESKSHFKKCVEKGINPNAVFNDNFNVEDGVSGGKTTDLSIEQTTEDGDSVSDDYSDGDDLEIDMESSDNEDTKLPDHEAAHCLLSLSQRSPSTELNISPNSQYVIYIKNEPIISKMSASMDGNATVTNQLLPETKQKLPNTYTDAIDLSKTSSVGAAELLKSLMTLSDKVPTIPLPAFDLNLAQSECDGQQSNLTNNQIQTYLTERALQKSKMKFSQVYMLNAFNEKTNHKLLKDSVDSTLFPMRSTKLDHIEVSSKPCNRDNPKNSERKLVKLDQQSTQKDMNIDNQQIKEELSKENIKQKLSANQPNDTTEKCAVKIELHITESSNKMSNLTKDPLDKFGMETLAEIAANSVKFDATKSIDVTASVQNRDIVNATSFVVSNKVPANPSEVASPNEMTSKKEISAKNIASEYLKLVNEQENAAAIDDSSTSSDSDVTGDSDSKHSRRSSVMSLGPEVLISARTVVVGEDGFKSKSSKSNDLPMVALPRGSSSTASTRPNIAFIQEGGGPSRCTMCSASFPKSHQLVLHMNIHYMNPERKFRCNSCGINFHTQGRLQKHMHSETHNSKVNMVETQGNPTSKNPRPFECSDCNRAFRIHGHLAKHLRSKTHVQKLECLQKLPFGTYAMIEEARINLTDIDTTDCDNSLASLKALAEKLKVESNSTEKPKSIHENIDSQDMLPDSNYIDQTTNENTAADKNISCTTIKKRKLNEGLKEILTIGEGDDN